MKSISKQNIQDKIKEIFSKNSDTNEIKKIRKLASSKNIKLGENRKRFCKKCNCLFDSKSIVRIKKGFKIIKCPCGNISRYKLK